MTRLVATLVLLGVLSAGCADAADASGPPEIVFGRDLCVECGMLITEPRFASAYWFEGEARTFDDIGNMLKYGIEHDEIDATSTTAWVHDYSTEEWLPADTAWYVFAPGMVTPMGWGIVAFTDRADAAAAAEERAGEVYPWADLFGFSFEQGRLEHEHDTHGQSAP